jgi:catechol 2,3-dioxygenase-like lactoylglutathione lyase family enzyme
VPTLGPITGVTVRTPSLETSETLYRDHLGYQPRDRGRVSALQAEAWLAPGAAGRPFLTMTPAGGTDFEFRFVQYPSDPDYRAFTRHGWNAAEIIVADVDRSAEQLADSPFELVAPPMDLSFCADIRAMQVRGPGGEILYLTQFKRPVPGLPAPPARCAVDRAFIVIVGGSSLQSLQDFYASAFGVARAAAVESRVQTMALAFGLSRETRFRIAALPLRGDCYIEADEMPTSARALPTDPADLVPGISMVSFHGSGTGAPRVLRGSAGELLELV